MSSSGVPRTRKMRNSWSISESPGNSGDWLIISANMHPMDHASTGVL